MKLLIPLGVAALTACAQPLGPREHPLAGRIWDVRAEHFVAPDELFDHAARARHVILGETHDNPEHHRLQRVVLEALAARGEKRLLAMEQFDIEYQPAIDAARAKRGNQGADAERIADAGHFDRPGWNWPLYQPLVQFALEHGWPLVAANLSRAEARAIVADPARAALPAAPPAVMRALERDIIDGHCGVAPDAQRLAGMVEAQRARDARMASGLRGPSVLIAGAGHARRDRGVPLYLGGGEALSVAFVEVEPGRSSPRDYVERASYDYLWFTPRAAREDPCKSSPAPKQVLEQLRLDRLDVERVAARLQHPRPMRLSKPRDGDDQRVFAPWNATQLRGHLAAFEVGQPNVQENEFRPQLPGHSERRASIGRVGGVVPHIQQQQEKRLRGIDVVVDYQDAPAWIGLRLRLRLHLPMLFTIAAPMQGSISGRSAF